MNYNFVQSGLNTIVGSPIGLPPLIPNAIHGIASVERHLPPPEMPGQGLKRAVN